ISGGSPLYLLRILVLLSLLSLAVTALGVGLSSLVGRPLGSVVLSYLVVIGAMVILPVVWAASLPMLVVPQETISYHEEPFDPMWTQTGSEPGPEPTLVLPDGAPRPEPGDMVCVGST